MSALDVRSNSAVMKRAEQLKRWEESDTNRSPASPRPEHGRKIKFSSGCVFLAACLSSDKEEVLKLLENGADINTANVDGLTALHQACIDDNLDMVEFLVEHGADINRQDNEGWTPLHATASCGFVSIARFLVENGADVSAVNSDGDLALDLAIDIQQLPIIEYMQEVINEHKVDCEKARQAEEQMMLADAKKWLRSDASEVDRPHAKTGATALHVASAKGYTKVISLLLAGRANVDKQDNDGWTPLHAAAHWGQKEAAEMLVDAMADMEIRNYAGQTCMEVADRKMIKTLEELRAKSKRSIKRRPSSQIRISDATEHHIENLAPKIFRTELKNNLNNVDDKNLTKTVPTTTTTITTTTTTTNTKLNENEQKQQQEQQQSAGKVTTTETCNISGTKATITTTTSSPDVIEATFTIPKSAMNIPPVTAVNSNAMVVENEDAPWRRNNLVQRVRLQLPDRLETTTTNKDSNEISDVVLRRSQSFDKDKKKPFMPQRTALSLALNSTSVNATVTIPTIATNTTATLTTGNTTTTTTITPATTTTTQSGTNTTPQRRSFAPPARNEESETQRKAHAKRVRESRRSTQGVTLDEIKSAEELVKKSNSTTTSTTTTNSNNLSTTATNTATTTTTTTSTKKDDINSVEATFTPTNNSKIILSAPAVIVAAQRNSLERPKNTTNVDSISVADANTYVSKRFSNSNSIAATNIAEQDKDNDKENDNRTTLTTQAVLQRRRKPKRRSTGVVHIDMDDLDPERSDGTNDAEEKDDADEGMIDYKKLWEAEKLDREKLKQQVDKKDEEILQLKSIIERNTSAANAKNSISELEKRERRAMERKLSEMEEELKQLELYKTENQRLKEENGALIRVISKLSK